jgi:hypothetical protein
MSSDTQTETVDSTGMGTLTGGSWQAGVFGGIAGAIAMGALVSAMSPETLAVAIPSLYTLAPPPSGVAGWVVHVPHGAVLGVVFAALVGAFDVESTGKTVAAGLAWGVVTWVALAALVMPVWLGAVGSPANPPFPNFAVPSLLWHVVYGLVLGCVYAVGRDGI